MGRRLAAYLLAASAALSACSVATEGAPCASAANCPSGQGCGLDGRCSVRALSCVACSAGASRCGAGGLEACEVSADGVCAAWAVKGCGASQACQASAAGASCACVGEPASACKGGATRCSADRSQVIACAADAQGCLLEGAHATPCDPGQICGDAATCLPTYAVALTSPAAGSLVGPAGVAVTATVRLATADPAFAPIPAVVLLADGATTGVTLTPGGANGLDVPYAGTWVPPAGADAAVQLEAHLEDSGTRAYESAPLQVQVDTTAPVVSAPVVTCSTTPCVRDAVLTVSATVTDSHLATVGARLDLDGARTVTLTNGGGGDLYSAQLDVRDWPFPHFGRDVTAAVTAVDAAGNSASHSLPPLTVTRLRWGKSLTGTPQLTGPAVDGAGNVVVAGNDRTLYRLAPDTGTATAASLTAVVNPGAGPTQPPVFGATAAWIATDDGLLFRLLADGTTSATCPSAPTGQQLYRPVLGAGAPDVAHAGGNNGANSRIYGVGPSTCSPFSVDAVTAPLSGASGLLFAPSSGARASLNRYTIAEDGALALAPSPPPSLQDKATQPNQCNLISTAPAVDGLGRVFAACDNRQVHLVDFAAGRATYLATLGGRALESAVVLPGDDIVVGTDDNRVQRLAPSFGPPLWSTSLSSPPTGIAVVAPDAAGVALLVLTRAGTLHALTGNGVEVWSATGADALGTAALRFPAVAPPSAGALPSALPTLYASSAGGVVYAVVVDTPLDTASPWPKAHHDLRNTGNAASPLP